MKKQSSQFSLSVLIALLATATASNASLVTSSAGFTSPTMVNFNAFSGIGYNFTFGPTAVGSGVIFTASPPNNSGLGAVLGSGSYALNGNGTWNFGTTPGGAWTGVDGSGVTSSMTYTLGSPTDSIGGFMNYSSTASSVLIQALDSSSLVLETYNLMTAAPISTPSGLNAGAFRGIVRATPDIYAFRVVGGYGVLDDLTFTTVPEPSILAFAIIGFSWTMAGRRLRHSRA